jgi:hypothetical protein
VISTFSCPCYYYNVGSQGFTGTLPTYQAVNFGWGAVAPSLQSGDAHTLVENSVEKTISGQRQIVEVGARNSGSGMKIFVYHWINSVGQGYGTNFTVVGTPTYAPNTAVGPGTTLTSNLHFHTQYVAAGGGYPAAWWIGVYPVGGTFQWVGYYAASLWTGAGVSGFTDIDLGQVFGEIASTTHLTASTVCSGMGSETLATNAVGASLGSAATNLGLETQFQRESPTGIDPYWNVASLSNSTFRFGGPGAC